MHTAAVTILSWIVIAAVSFAPTLFATAGPALLALLVALVGLPHGAADHRFAESAFRPLIGRHWAPVFLVAYLGIAVVVVLGWIVSPAVTIVAFFLASAWHFGLEERTNPIGPRQLRGLMRAARGGLMIWIPIVFNGPEVAEILRRVTPLDAGSAVVLSVTVLHPIAVGMLTLAAAAWGLQSLRAVASTGLRRRVLLADSVLVASMAVMFAVVDPLVAFVVYFCGWHSARGLTRLRIELGESWYELARSLAPMTVLAIAMVGIGAWLVWPAAGLDTALVRSTFIGLSALAAPHLLLHAVEPVLRRLSGVIESPVLAAAGGSR